LGFINPLLQASPSISFPSLASSTSLTTASAVASPSVSPSRVVTASAVASPSVSPSRVVTASAVASPSVSPSRVAKRPSD